MLVTLFHAYEQRLVAKACNRSSQSCQPQRGSPVVKWPHCGTESGSGNQMSKIFCIGTLTAGTGLWGYMNYKSAFKD